MTKKKLNYKPVMNFYLKLTTKRMGNITDSESKTDVYSSIFGLSTNTGNNFRHKIS